MLKAQFLHDGLQFDPAGPRAHVYPEKDLFHVLIGLGDIFSDWKAG